MRRAVSVLSMLAALMLPSVARSQTANMNVSAIVDVALVGEAIRNLAFGYVTPGGTQTVNPSETPGCAGCASGKWSIQGLFKGNQPNRRNMAITFTQLPASLTSTSGATLPLAWTNSAKGCLTKAGVEYYCFPSYTPVQGTTVLHQINGAGAPGTPFEPAGGGTRNFDMYLGGIAQPTAGQRAGYYTGTITLQFAYSN